MGLFHSKPKDKLIKYFRDNNISFNDNDGRVETEIIIPNTNISVFPYFKIIDDENYISIVINIKKISGKINVDLYEKINYFNLSSKYFVMKLSNNILYLEYNTIYDDNIVDIYNEAITSLNELIEFIDNI